MFDTNYLVINPDKPELEIIRLAAEYILKGEIIAFPTETVYGVGGYAFNSEAAKKVFEAKKRPMDSPLLVHVSNIKQVEKLVKHLSPDAIKLMDKFWPGPLSFILPASENVPLEVTGGKDTVGLRMPSHPVALALIEITGPLAATSANLSGRPSPINASHVKNDLDNRIPLVLDAGTTGIGVESTLVDLSSDVITILRQGGVKVEDIEDCLNTSISVLTKDSKYQTKLQIIRAKNTEDFNLKLFKSEGKKIGIVHNNLANTNNIENVAISYHIDVTKNSGDFFSLLRDAETNDLEVLIFAPIPEDAKDVSNALLERINKAANFKE